MYRVSQAKQVDRIKHLHDRAHMLSRARQFFLERNVLEVDCPALSRFASVDSHIDLIPALYQRQDKAYLHSSPEYGIKRLLAEGIGDVYQLSHVFRDGEFGRHHNPEFMMAEWYRCGISFQAMIDETLDFIRLFVGDLYARHMTYREMFQHYAGIDYTAFSVNDLLHFLEGRGIEASPDVVLEGKDALLNQVLGTVIEPQLGVGELFVLTHYPASQAALAKTLLHGDELVAERFEVYLYGIELANGYHELTDYEEQLRRCIEANRERKKMGKEELPIDENFLSAMAKGIPQCCGVAVGFDRLMMLRHNAGRLSDVIPFSWDQA